MASGADSKSKLEAARQQALAEQAARETEHVAPVRSAKDAINAMYAQEPDKRLSSYLAKSAKEIINSGGSNGDQKSAASLHQHAAKRRIEMERPSASGILRAASPEPPIIIDDSSRGMDPLAQKTTPAARPHVIKPVETPTPSVIKTSLKLGPKKTPAASSLRSATRVNPPRSLNGQKGKTALSQLLSRRSAPAAPVATSVTPARPAAQSPAPAPSSTTRQQTSATPALDPATAETLRAMRQAVKQTTAQSSTNNSAPSVRIKKRTSRGSMQDVIRVPRQASVSSQPSSPSPNDHLPPDSVKHRFRAAPKGYTAAPETQPTSYAGFDQAASSATKKPPIEIYGLMDDEPTGDSRPALPPIEDYQPNETATATPRDATTKAADDNNSPDNNKYALNGQSPFFLKSVNVEKRPLSGSIKKSPSEGTLYERPAPTPVGDKNVYDRKEARKALPTKPTVIIPASRRSRAPLIFLLILTVILGAAVGAFIYLCFFQYME